jgi:hypothetical protein
MRASERPLWAEWHGELSEPIERGQAARVPDGLKLNAGVYLRQRGDTVAVEAAGAGAAT